MKCLRKAVLASAFVVPLMVASCRPHPPVSMKVVYQIHSEKLPPSFEPSSDTMAQVVDVLERRLGFDGIGRILEFDEKSVEVGIFRAPPDKMQRFADFLERPGTLEVRILANPHDHKKLIQRAQNEDTVRAEDDEGRTLARWVPVHHASRNAFESYVAANEVVSRTRQTKNSDILEILVVDDEFDVTEKYIKVAHAAVDEDLNPCINILLSEEGGRRLAGLTLQNVPDSATDVHRKLAFIVDGRLRAADPLQSPLRHRFRITGLNCGRQEARQLAWALYSGPLPVPIRKIDECLVDGTPPK